MNLTALSDNPRGALAWRWFKWVFLCLWLVELSLFFLLRFSFAFYFENQDAIKGVLGK